MESYSMAIKGKTELKTEVGKNKLQKQLLIDMIDSYIDVTALDETVFGIDVESYPGSWLGQKLINALADASDGDVLDCRKSSVNQIHERVIVDKSVTILLPYGEITCYPAAGTDIFDIRADGVTISGEGRAEDINNLVGTYISMGNGRYHFYSRGNSLLTISDLSCKGYKSSSEPRDEVKVFNGNGGIYIEKQNPGTTEADNNVNCIILNNLFVHGTYAHGIYVDTPILSLFRNIRIGETTGHGFFCWGGTSSTWQNCYVSSADYAGFCIYQHTYGSMLGCSSEYAGIGYWLRSSNSVTLNGCGVEYATNRGGTVYSLGLETTDSGSNPVPIPDISTDYPDIFRGSSYVVTGGNGILFNTIRSSNPSQPHPIAGTSTNSRHILIKGSAEGVTFWNPTLGMSVGETYSGRFDVEVAKLALETPTGITLQYNPANGTVTPAIPDYITSDDSAGSSTYILSETNDLLVQDGAIIYSSFFMSNLKQGIDQLTAGAALNELWVDNNNFVRIGV